MEIRSNCGQLCVMFNVEERELITANASHLINGRRFIERSEEELESILFRLFPELAEKDVYLAFANRLGGILEFHPRQPKSMKVKTFYHATTDIESVMAMGLKGFRRSRDGIRFTEDRIYFSTKPFSEMRFIDTYLNGRQEIMVEFPEEVEVFYDPEFEGVNGMVYMRTASIPTELITETGFTVGGSAAVY